MSISILVSVFSYLVYYLMYKYNILNKSLLDIGYNITKKDGFLVGEMSGFPDFKINNNKLMVNTTLLDIMISPNSMKDLNSYLVNYFDADSLLKYEITFETQSLIYKTMFLTVLIGSIVGSYTKLPWWVYFTCMPSAHQPIYNFYIHNKNKVVFIFLTYLYLLSYSFTNFNNKFLNKLQKALHIPNFSIDKLLNLIYSCEIPYVTELLNSSILKEIIIRHILFNIVTMFLLRKYNYVGGSRKKITLYKSMKSNKSMKSLFLLNTKYNRFTKKDYKKEFSKYGDIKKINVSNIFSKYTSFIKNNGIKFMFSVINDYLRHESFNLKINDYIVKIIEKNKSHKLNKQFKSFIKQKYPNFLSI